MTKEIIVNAAELESRVAILENGRVMELHIEREPKIIGNIYKGRVTKVLKGMDAAFVDIGAALNAFLSAADVVPQIDDDEGNGGGGRNRDGVPPITQLLRNNQEILVQVVRAPMGTKGARITTRLSLPGRYMVLMLNSGAHVGISRKIEDSKERTRLRSIATRLRPESMSLIVRTEAEGRSEEELEGDLKFLLDMANRLLAKADHSPAPSLVHGDLNLILRLIRDAFTRDVNRLVVDSSSAYESVVELVEMLSPHLKNRIYLYDEPVPIFHAYNIEPEIERTLRRRVWLPSGGYLIIDQAEALTAIDVNTGRFVGSVELAETVLTTNLQAAEEVARQLRLRDLGGIIVVDFIDMDNARHRQQVMRAFEEALKRDRAKIKVHNISALGLVEMTRKRTGESLVTLLTEPCPYCSGIGRIQNPLTMALSIQREVATVAVEHPNTEAFLITAHPRVVANLIGYEGEIHQDLEQYLGRTVYLRSKEEYHPNTYRLEHLTLEQALVAVPHLEEGEIVEAQVVNPDPEISVAPLVRARDMYIVVPNLDAPVGARVKVRITETNTSLAIGEPLADEQRGIRGEAVQALAPPPLVPMNILPAYLREERTGKPPREHLLLSPTAHAVGTPETGEETPLPAFESARDLRRRRNRRRREAHEEIAEEQPAVPAAEVEAAPIEEMPPLEELPMEGAGIEATERGGRRRRRRRKKHGAQAAGENLLQVTPETEEETEQAEPIEAVEVAAAAPSEEQPVEHAKRRRRSRGRRGKRIEVTEVTPPAELPEAPVLPDISLFPSREEAPSPEALVALVNALPEQAEEAPAAEAVIEEAPAKPARRRRTPRRKAAEAPAEITPEAPLDTTPEEAPPAAESEPAPPTVEGPPVEPAPAEKPARKRPTRRRTKKAEEPAPEQGEGTESAE